MLRYVLWIFRADVRSWLPTVVVVGLVTVLIGLCVSQFIWTSSDAFTGAALGAGLDPAEFVVVSLTIYVLVAVLSFSSLTVIGAATVEHTRTTFAQWRLAGASPVQVRVACWSLAGVASVAGAFPGSLASTGLSVVAIPVFNQLAAASFSGGTGSFDAPVIQPSVVTWAVAFTVGVVTCMLGTLLPARRAARVEPVEAIRGPAASGSRGGRTRLVTGGMILAAALVLGLAGASSPRTADVGVEATGMVNSAIATGLVSALGVHLLGGELALVMLSAAHAVLRPIRGATVAVMAARSARATVRANANVVAPLGVAIGLSGVVFGVLRSYQATMSAAGFTLPAPNYQDTVVMTGLFGFMALLTSVAVIALSGRDAAWEQAQWRTAGMTPLQVLALAGWQGSWLALCAAVSALVPVAAAGIVLAVRSAQLVGHPILVAPWEVPAIAALACWGVLFGTKLLQMIPWVRRDTASSLRRA